MRITDVEGIVLQSPEKYGAPESEAEAEGVAYCFLLKVSTDEGVTGWSDVETAPHIAASIVSAPDTGSGMFEGLRELAVGEDPFETERLWDKICRASLFQRCRRASERQDRGGSLSRNASYSFGSASWAW